MKHKKLAIAIFTTVCLAGIIAGFFLIKGNHQKEDSFAAKPASSEPRIVSPTPSPTSRPSTLPSPRSINRSDVYRPTPTIIPTQTPTFTPDSSTSSGNGSSSVSSTPAPCETLNNSDYDEVILADNPVLFLPLGSLGATACDHSVNSYNGTSFGGFSLVNMPNNTDQALVFDGVDDYVSVYDRESLGPAYKGRFTFEAWIRPDTLQFENEEGSGYVHWMGKGTTNQQEFVARMYSLVNDEGRPNRISGYAFNLEGGLGVGSYFQDSVSAGEWIHYAFVINTADTSDTYPMGYTKIYKNGAERDVDDLSSLSIVPANGTAPFRVGTRDFSSFFKGAIGKVALYAQELTAFQIQEHYQTMVPPVAGSASFVAHVGSSSTKTTGATLTITLTDTVAAGDTLIVRVLTDYTSGAPTVADSKGNTYVRDRTAPNSGLDMRASLFSAPVTTALASGDTITITTPVSVNAKVAAVDQFRGLLAVEPLDQVNGTSGTSTTPGTTISITTTQKDQVIIGFTGVEGPADDSFTQDLLGQFTDLTRAGTTGGDADTNLTINGGYKSLEAIDTYQYRPTLGTSRDWISFIASYKAAN